MMLHYLKTIRCFHITVLLGLLVSEILFAQAKYGIYSNNAAPVIENNTIRHCNSYGIYLANGYSGQPLGGRNSIHSNNDYDVKAELTSVITAQHNWWGTANPQASQFSSDGSSSINYSYPLSSDPGGGSSLAKGTSTQNEWDDFDPGKVDENDPAALYKLARYYRLVGELEKSIDTYKQIVDEFPSAPEAVLSLVKIFHISEKYGLKETYNYYLSLQNQKDLHKNLTRTVLSLLSALDLRNGNIESAVSNCEAILEKFPGTGDEILALYNLVHINQNQLQDTDLAQNYLNQMQEKYPDDELTLAAQEEVSGETGKGFGKPGAKELPTGDSDKIPAAFALYPAWPNPFNPGTTISFDVPEAAKVTLVIYDILGRTIWGIVGLTLEKLKH